MIYVLCRSCKSCLRVSPGQPGELEAMMSGLQAKCWDCEQPLIIHNEVPVEDIHVIDVNPQEAYAAVNGLGLPTEKDCTAAAVTQLLTERRVTRVSATQIRDSHRCIIEYLELEDGSKVYLGSSAYGATVFRVSNPISYVENIDGQNPPSV